jgi:hypothetical protein
VMVGSVSISILLPKQLGAARTWNIPRFHPNRFTEFDKFRQNLRFRTEQDGFKSPLDRRSTRNKSAIAVRLS